MFNIHFSEHIEKDFRQDLQEKLKLTIRETDAFMFKVRSLFVSEEQHFPADFKSPSKVIRRITERTGKNFDDVKKEALENPAILFDALKIPHAQPKNRQFSQESIAAVSPARRMQMQRQLRSGPTRTFSLETSQLLLSKTRLEPVIGKTVSRAHFEKQIKDKDAPPRKTPSQRKEAGRVSRAKPVPTMEEIAKAAHLIKQETGKRPNAKSGNKHLPDDGPQWSTLFQHVLKGENSLGKLMDRYPVDVEKPAPTQQTNVARETDAPKKTERVEVPDVAPVEVICTVKKPPTDVEIVLHDTRIHARDVFNGLMRLARKKVLPTTSSAFHYVEGKTLRQIDTLLKKGEISGIDTLLTQNPLPAVSSLNDFMVATGIAQKSGKSLALSRPVELDRLAKTLG